MARGESVVRRSTTTTSAPQPLRQKVNNNIVNNGESETILHFQREQENLVYCVICMQYTIETFNCLSGMIGACSKFDPGCLKSRRCVSNLRPRMIPHERCSSHHKSSSKASATTASYSTEADAAARFGSGMEEMGTFFYASNKVTLLFQSWRTDSDWEMTGAVASTLLLLVCVTVLRPNLALASSARKDPEHVVTRGEMHWLQIAVTFLAAVYEALKSYTSSTPQSARSPNDAGYFTPPDDSQHQKERRLFM